MAHFYGKAHWDEPSPMFAHKARPSPLHCKNKHLVLALREETAVQVVVGSIVWAFRRLKKPMSREMSARGYALHSLRPQLLSFCPIYKPIHWHRKRNVWGKRSFSSKPTWTLGTRLQSFSPNQYGKFSNTSGFRETIDGSGWDQKRLRATRNRILWSILWVYT